MGVDGFTADFPPHWVEYVCCEPSISDITLLPKEKQSFSRCLRMVQPKQKSGVYEEEKDVE